MEWQSSWEDPIGVYLKPFNTLVGDKRTWTTFTETVKGIIQAGSPCGRQPRTLTGYNWTSKWSVAGGPPGPQRNFPTPRSGRRCYAPRLMWFPFRFS